MLQILEQYITWKVWFTLLTDYTNFYAGCLVPEPLPPEFPLEKTIQLCILDTSFLELVSKVDAVLQDMHL
jgi:hypothetical protein